MSDSNVDAVTFELSWETAHVRLSVVIREHHLGLDSLCGLNQLVWSHGVGLVAGQESDVDVLDG